MNKKFLVIYLVKQNNKKQENLGVMSDTGTAMRDPVFYRWHAYIDSIFDRYKQNLEPYNPTGVNC
jgi:hypothetical protein